MGNTECPKAEELAAFSAGSLPVESFEDLAQHLEGCAGCLTLVEILARADDPLLAALRGPVPADDFARETQCQAAITHLATAIRQTIVAMHDRGRPNQESLGFEIGPAHAAEELLLTTQPFLGHAEPATPAPEGTDSNVTRTPDGRQTAPSEADAELVPRRRRFGKYEILDMIPGGGMGIVYKARDTVLGRVVALKTLRNGILASQDEIDRFEREAKIIAHLKNPHIITLYDYGVEDGVPFYVMEFHPGGTLAKKIDFYSKESPLKAVTVMEKVARALHEVHEHKIYHRDIKPSNILVDVNGEPVIADFGLAKSLDATTMITRDAALMGTLPYLPAELVSGLATEPSARSDVWALGVVLYELLTGRRPFSGNSRETLLTNIRRADPPSPRYKRRDVHPDLEAVILKCLEKNPAARYESALDFADDLANLQKGKPPTKVRPHTWPEKAWRKTTKNWKIPVALAMSICIICGVWGFYAFNSDVMESDVPNGSNRRLGLLQQDLAKGQVVELIGKTGSPVWSRFRVGERNGKLQIGQDGTFSLDTLGTCLLELMPDTKLERYALQGWVRQNDNVEDGLVGFYFNHSQFAMAGVTENFYCVLGFAETQVEARKVRTDLYHFTESHDDPGASHRVAVPLHARLPAGDGLGTWRELRVEITPKKMSAWLGNTGLGVMQRAELNSRIDILLKGPPKLNFAPTFAPSDGLGLYVSRGSASFKLVTIEPLMNEPE
jgi:serine/threonine protein kinase